jgi:DNA-binding NarL/FixJ family response regulator
MGAVALVRDPSVDAITRRRGRVRVLIVDDTQSVRERLAAMIAALPGVEHVMQETNGVAGLVAIAMDAPAVVVLDIRMPGLNGLQVLAALKGAAGAPVCVVVSNHVEYREHALQAGASFFFDKSTELDGMLTMIGELARRPGALS